MFLNQDVNYYTIAVEHDTYAIIPVERGEWVKSKDYTNLMNLYVDSQLTIEDLKIKLENAYRVLKSMESKQHYNLIICPRCKSSVENTEMRSKQCTVCHFEWETNKGY